MISPAGPWLPVGFRIDKESGQYFGSFGRGGPWQRGPRALHNASDSDYMALMLIGAGPVYAVKCD
ncbi:hypothetical protein ABFC53_16240 [Stenotrophomonas pavanii]|uniref:hypothetical protein n=1 Tax=Stenotrophomonas pavanii TaxID=487698 RepID=UPI00320CE76C